MGSSTFTLISAITPGMTTPSSDEGNRAPGRGPGHTRALPKPAPSTAGKGRGAGGGVPSHLESWKAKNRAEVTHTPRPGLRALPSQPGLQCPAQYSCRTPAPGQRGEDSRQTRAPERSLVRGPEPHIVGGEDF